MNVSPFAFALPLLLTPPVATNPAAKPPRLATLFKVVYLVGEEYLEPSRIDPERMFVASLGALEAMAGEVRVEEPRKAELVVHVGAAARTFSAKAHDLDELAVRLQDVFTFLGESMPPGTDFQKLERTVIRALLSTLDPYSSLESDDENRRELQFGGVGIVLSREGGVLRVLRAFGDSPAQRAGVQAGDEITAIDGTPAKDLSLEDAASRIGGPKGSSLILAFVHPGSSETSTAVLVREAIPVVAGDLVSDDIAYLAIERFSGETPKQVSTSLRDIRKKAPGTDLKGIVLDLRGNGGGYLEHVARTAAMFVGGGAMARFVHRESSRDLFSSPQDGEPTVPLVVLVDGDTSAGAETFAAIIQDRDRGLVAGVRTHGSGIARAAFDMVDGSTLLLAVEEAQRLSGARIEGVGVVPDVEIVSIEIGERVRFGARQWRRPVRKEGEPHRFAGPVPLVSGRDLAAAGSPHRVQVLRNPGGLWHSAADPEVRVAGALLRAGSPTRTQALEKVESVLERIRKEQEPLLLAAFPGKGIEWGPPDRTPPKLAVKLVASGDKSVQVTVTNTGKLAASRVHAVLTTSGDTIEPVHVLFGKIAPGSSKTSTLTFESDPETPEGAAEVTVLVHQDGGAALVERSIAVRVDALPISDSSRESRQAGLPVLTAAPKRGAYIVANTSVEIEAAASHVGGLRDVWMLVNGKKLVYRSAEGAATSVSFSGDVPLLEGLNLVEIRARATDGSESARRFQVFREAVPKAKPKATPRPSP